MEKCRLCGEFIDYNNPNIHYGGHTCDTDRLNRLNATERFVGGIIESYKPNFPKHYPYSTPIPAPKEYKSPKVPPIISNNKTDCDNIDCSECFSSDPNCAEEKYLRNLGNKKEEIEEKDTLEEKIRAIVKKELINMLEDFIEILERSD